jgi:LDH2 family malate/lactate/ureidoglycolate dehydrogenase
MPNIIVTIEELTAFCRDSLLHIGANESDASTVADALVMTDSWGVFTHGTKLLRDYLLRIQAGGISVDQYPMVERQGPAWAIVQANCVMGHVAGRFAMETAIEKARAMGIAYVGVKNTNHFGAAGYYSWLAAQRGLIGISMANDIPSVAAPGSTKAVTGSNPLSYAVPIGEGRDPILLDMAISTVAGGKVFAAQQRGEPIPDNWILGRDGMPTTDSRSFPLEAALQPMSGPKGYGLALLIESLSGVLSGAAITWQVGSWVFGDKSKPTNHGAAFLAVDVESIMARDEFNDRINYLVDEIHAAPAIDAIDRVMLPGEREWKNRTVAMRNGIRLPEDVLSRLFDVAELVDLHPDWLLHRGRRREDLPDSGGDADSSCR